MPFSGPSSYLTTIDEFVGHWTDVDAELVALGGLGSELKLTGPYALTDLQAHRTELASKMTVLETELNDVETLRGQRDNQKEPLHEFMRQFNGLVRSQLRDSSYVAALRDTVHMNDNPGKWIIAMDDIANLWADINAAPPAGFTGPLLLAGGYAVATFVTDIAALKTTFEDLSHADQHVDQVLQEREEIFRAIRERLVQYRGVVESSFAADHPLVLSLPRVYPLPGHTPDPVVLSGVWNAGTTMADLSWTASVDPDLDHYEVRRSSSDPYNSNTEVMVESVPAGTLVLSTVEGLPGSGSTMRYKVYVVLNTSNEKGSNAVTINRP
jgi:hypothetical protein